MTSVLLASDLSVSEPLAAALRGEGYTVEISRDEPQALQCALGSDHDLILLGQSPLQFLDQMRAIGYEVPVVVLGSDDSETDTVVSLDAGADDYVARPFRLAELLARIRAVLRRGARKGASMRGVRIDADGRKAWINGEEMRLTTKEFDLLCLLIRNAGKVVTRKQIMREVWRTDWMGKTKTLDMHISTLRRKLGDDAACPRYITTERGIGWRFERD